LRGRRRSQARSRHQEHETSDARPRSRRGEGMRALCERRSASPLRTLGRIDSRHDQNACCWHHDRVAVEDMKRGIQFPDFGKEVRRRREARGMTLEQLAARSGLTPNYIGGVEIGKRDPSVSTMQKLAHGLNVHPSELLECVMDVSPAAMEVGRTVDGLPGEIRELFVTVMRVIVNAIFKQRRR
jgi:transcriptional regulator with XRE-family HTH domain